MEYNSAMKKESTKKHRGAKMHFNKWKKPVWKDSILYDSNYVTFRKQNYSNSKWSMVAKSLGGVRKRGIGEAQGIFRAVQLFGMIL